MTILPLHVAAGVLALGAGYVALFAPKGALTHRRSGRLFGGAMLVMALSGALLAGLNGSRVNLIAGLLTFYFVTTAWLTVRRRASSAPGWIDRVTMSCALLVSVLAFVVGIEIAGRGRPETIPMFIFGAVGLLAAAGDARVLRAGGIHGSRRIARHLWRMCFAMWIAAASFFWGPPGRVPDLINIPSLLPLPVLLPVAVMIYWLWRLRAKPSAHPIVASSGPRTAVFEKI